MKKPKLVVMAAGLGSRYGGLKQMEPITDEGEILLDFGCYDAVSAGFEEIIFIIKPEMEDDFVSRILCPMSKHVKTSYVFQDISQLPKGYTVPKGRVKPWGTCHALMAAKELLDGPFAVINSDDYYGKDSFKKVFEFLTDNDNEDTFCMAGYLIQNTLSDQGAVTRGICKEKEGFIIDITETKGIFRNSNGDIVDENEKKINEGTIVSMNFWGFTGKMIEEMINGFPSFLDNAIKNKASTEEYLLPNKVGELLRAGECNVKTLISNDKWYGVTYKEDKEQVSSALKQMKQAKIYPQKLWEL